MFLNFCCNICWICYQEESLLWCSKQEILSFSMEASVTDPNSDDYDFDASLICTLPHDSSMPFESSRNWYACHIFKWIPVEVDCHASLWGLALKGFPSQFCIPVATATATLFWWCSLPAFFSCTCTCTGGIRRFDHHNGISPWQEAKEVHRCN